MNRLLTRVRRTGTRTVIPIVTLYHQSSLGSLPIVSVLFMPTIVLLDENGGVSLGLLLPLPALVVPVGFLNHSSGVVELPLLPIGERQPAQIGLAPVAAPDTSTCSANSRAKYVTELSISAGIILAVVPVAVQLQL